jgi:hypothetical protein
MMVKKGIVFSLAMLIVLTMSVWVVHGSDNAQDGIIYMDDFESYADQAEFEKAYDSGGRAFPTLSKAANHTENGSQSIAINEGEFFEASRLIYSPGQTLNNVELSIWVRSNGPNTYERGIFRVQQKDGAEIVLGVWPSRDKFVYRHIQNGVDSGWRLLEAAKTEGWHKLAIRVTDTGTTLLVNDVALYEAPDFVEVYFAELRDFWGNFAEELEPAYFDDFVVKAL